MPDHPDIALVLPVGPLPVHRAYLDDCFESIAKQSVRISELIVVMDGGTKDDYQEVQGKMGIHDLGGLKHWAVPYRIPATVGPAAAWNIGIAVARSELCFMMGADDWLEPTCIEELGKAWTADQNHNGYYSVTIRYDDERPDPIQDLPCNAAMVHKRGWRHIGGFPVETASGAPDAALVSIMLKHRDAGRVIHVARGRPLYNVRVHPGQDTALRRPWQGVVLATRNLLTETWRPPHAG